MTRRTTSYEGFICRFSIFTIVDWLTFERRARAVCVSPRAFRSRGTSSRSGIISRGNGPRVHIPAGIFRAIAYYWSVNRSMDSIAPFPDLGDAASPWRSEEHTSELQSRPHLVCRLLLEQNKRYCNPSNILYTCLTGEAV